VLKLIKYIREELLIVLGTSSSESALPRMLIKMERLGAKKSVVGLVIPTGYSFNLDGTSIYLTMAAVFIAQATNTHMDITHQITLLLVLLLSSKGAAGVTGSGFIVLAATLSAVGHLPVAGLALILGIDRFMSEARALTNLVGNAVATLVVAKWVKELDVPQMQAELASGGRAIEETRPEDDLGVAEGPAPPGCLRQAGAGLHRSLRSHHVQHHQHDHEAGATGCLGGHGLHHRRLRREHPGATGPADAVLLHHLHPVRAARAGRHRSRSRLQRVETDQVHPRRTADRAGYFLV